MWCQILSIGLCIFIWTGHGVHGATFAQVKTEYEKLVNAYTLDANNSQYYNVVPPRVDNSQPVTVTMGMSLFAISGYDAVAGTMDIVGSVTFEWRDEIATTKSITFDSVNVPSFMVGDSKVWTPVIVMENSANSVDRIGDSVNVRFNLSSQMMTWRPRVLLTSSCAPDVSKFPFDTQTCDFVFTSWYHDKDTVRLDVDPDGWDMENFSPNGGVWTVGVTRAESTLRGNYYYVTFTIEITRQSLYFTINLVCPILLLSVLSGFVFVLPPGSGERMGFGMTCFLTFVVLLQTMMNFLPEASKPMSFLCYYVILMMMFTAFMSIITVVILKIYNVPEDVDEPEPVPDWVITFIEYIKCVKCVRKCRKSQRQIDTAHAARRFGELVEPLPEKFPIPNDNFVNYFHRDTTQVKRLWSPINRRDLSSRNRRLSRNHPEKLPIGRGRDGVVMDYEFGRETRDLYETDDTDSRVGNWVEESKKVTEEEVDWETVGKILDNFFLAVFVGIQILLTVVFILPIAV